MIKEASVTERLTGRSAAAGALDSDRLKEASEANEAHQKQDIDLGVMPDGASIEYNDDVENRLDTTIDDEMKHKRSSLQQIKLKQASR